MVVTDDTHGTSGVPPSGSTMVAPMERPVIEGARNWTTGTWDTLLHTNPGHNNTPASQLSQRELVVCALKGLAPRHCAGAPVSVIDGQGLLRFLLQRQPAVRN